MFRLRLMMLPLVISIVACKGDEKDGGTDNSATDGSPTEPGDGSFDIVAADGGTVSLGDASLDIPAGALTEDTTVTVESSEPDASLPEFDSIVGLIYDFGPDGTQFDPAASLALPLPVTPGSGETAVISWLDTASNTWVDLASTVSGGAVTASVEHFTSFAVRIVVNGDTLDGECAFDGACGGDVTGTWNLDGFCMFFEEPTTAQTTTCVSVVVDADISGTFILDADHTYTADMQIDGEFQVTLDGACLYGLSDCSELDEEFEATCTGDALVSCTCVQAMSELDTSTGQWNTNGNILTADVDETGGETDSGPSSSEYCVSGNQLQTHDMDEGTVLTAHR
jgi:hypothetical protein